jgi:hypothetical protein
MAQSRAPWPALLAAGCIAALIFGATSLGWRDWSTGDKTASAVLRPGVCVTRAGLCQTRPAPAGYPCSCPNLLRGLVPGHVELLGDAPALPGSSDWSARDPDDDVERGLALPGP